MMLIEDVIVVNVVIYDVIVDFGIDLQIICKVEWGDLVMNVVMVLIMYVGDFL